MKKSFSVLGAFCLGLFISVAVIACAVDDDYTGNTNSVNNTADFALKSVSANFEGWNPSFSFEYDSNGIFKKVVMDDFDDILCVSYSGNIITLCFEGYDESYVIELNNKVNSYPAKEVNQIIINAMVMMS